MGPSKLMAMLKRRDQRIVKLKECSKSNVAYWTNFWGMTFPPPTLFPSPHEPALTREHVLRPQGLCGAVERNDPVAL